MMEDQSTTLDSQFTSSLVAKIYLTCTILELNIADNGQKQEKHIRTSISDHLQTPTVTREVHRNTEQFTPASKLECPACKKDVHVGTGSLMNLKAHRESKVC
jgi:hypothetical protein